MRVLEEAVALGERGVALLCAEETSVRAGQTLLDARGRRHRVGAVTRQDGLTMLHLPQGEAAYFQRLFRDVRVDGTLFSLEDAPCR